MEKKEKSNQTSFEFHLTSLNKLNRSIMEMNTISKFLVIYIIYPTPPNKQDAKQGQPSLRSLNIEFFFT